MRYSFIAPQKKSLFSMFTKVWLIFIASVVIVLMVFGLFLFIRSTQFKKDATLLDMQRIALEQEIQTVDHRIEFILKQKTLAEEIYANNLMLKESIKNLFDLVPDQITLSKVMMDKTSLTIYGTTPTKESYKFLLEVPLRSIFQESDTVFYLSDKGWYNFVSTNKIVTNELMGAQ
ncbi:MAG: hypothetical protein IBX44_03895 [Sulfurospirillum sp.]|nr:hypothetical protein [Sulfurospirillum sp.]